MSLGGQLQQGEEILYRAHPSRIVLLPPLLAAAAAPGILGVLIWNASGGMPSDGLDLHDLAKFGSGEGGGPEAAAALGVVALLAAVAVALARERVLRTRVYALTDRRLLRQPGTLGEVSTDSYLDEISNVEYRQDLWGRLLDYGDLEIDTASETSAKVFRRISRPLAFKRAIDAAVHANRHPSA